MNTTILRMAAIVSLTLVFVSCDHKILTTERMVPGEANTPKEKLTEKKSPAPESPTGACELLCWYVEDDGKGRSGYAFMDLGRSSLRPLRLFKTIDGVRKAISQLRIKRLWLSVGATERAGRRVRRLTTNEVKELGLADRTVWDQKP